MIAGDQASPEILGEREPMVCQKNGGGWLVDGI